MTRPSVTGAGHSRRYAEARQDPAHQHDVNHQEQKQTNPVRHLFLRPRCYVGACEVPVRLRRRNRRVSTILRNTGFVFGCAIVNRSSCGYDEGVQRDNVCNPLRRRLVNRFAPHTPEGFRDFFRSQTRLVRKMKPARLSTGDCGAGMGLSFSALSNRKFGFTHYRR